MVYGFRPPSPLLYIARRYTPWGEDDLDRDINLDPDHPIAAQEPYDGNAPTAGMLLSELLGDDD